MTSQIQFPNTTQMDFLLHPDMADTDLSPDATVKKELPKQLTSHGTTPSGKPRLYVCSICTRAFARMEHLHRHERSHTKEKPFTCGVCQRKFSRRDLLLRHAQKLHAGCSDAITRLRRKLIKSTGISSSNDSDVYGKDAAAQKELESIKSSNANGQYNLPTPKTSTPGFSTPSLSLQGLPDAINFNMDLFRAKENAQSGPATPHKMSRSSSLVKDQNLQRQIFDRRKSYRNRGASFSAQSGANYATALVDYQDSYPADNVEFSTPQLLPATAVDEHSWLSNLSTIPGMSINGGKSGIKPDYSMNGTNSGTGTNTGNGLVPDFFRSDSITSSNSLESSSANAPFMSHVDSLNKQTGSAVATPKSGNHDIEYGYTMYDIPESMMSGKTGFQSRINRPLSPIKQEMEDEMFDLENTATMKDAQYAAAITEGVNFDLNFLNDIDELTQDFDMGSKFQPNGYSFYGDNPLVSSSGIESTSPPPFMSPSSMHNGATSVPKLVNSYMANPNHTLGLGTQNVDLESLLGPKLAGGIPGSSKANGSSPYSTTTLFTKNMRLMINKALGKYPISGIMSPTIPTNEKLELYLANFTERFLSHFPFIHPSKLKELEVMAMTANEDPLNESARVCMPLLVATIGALLANDKNGSEHLYEASRRAIHIYLESRKNSVSDSGSQSLPINPLWLIQSLTLSVIYGLFSDNENNVYIVIRQLNALNSLVKTSVKNNKEYYFSVHGSYSEHNDDSYDRGGAYDANARFANAINAQSQVRIVLMIYKLTNFILMMYNVPLTISLNDLGNITCPNIYEEFLWRFYDYSAFSTYLRSIESPNDLDFYLHKDECNTIVFKDLLMKLMANDFGPEVVTKLSNMSKYGFTSLVQGIFEIKQYEEMKNLDVASILDNVALFLDSSKNNVATRFPQESQIDFEKLDCAMLINFVKLCSIVEFKLVKEQSWLRNYEELTRNYYKFLTTVDRLNDLDHLKVIDCCIIITKLMLFRTDDASLQYSNGKQEIFLLELNFLAGSSGYMSQFKTMVTDSLQHQYNTCANFEKAVNWKVFDEIDSAKNSVNSQMMFHIFTILSIFAVHIAKRNNPNTELGRRAKATYTKQLNQRFIIVLRLMAKIEIFLRTQAQLKPDTDLSGLYMLQGGVGGADDLSGISLDDADIKGLMENNDYFAYKLEKSLYILKLGEIMMKYLYDTNIKVCIFKKLSGSLSQLRKFLIDGESMILL